MSGKTCSSGLLDAELLIPVAAEQRGRPVSSTSHLIGERAALAHRLGPPQADRILQARQDAIVVIHGPMSMAGTIAATVAAAGVGHVHIDPDGSAGSVSARSPGSATDGLRDWYPTIRVQRPRPTNHRRWPCCTAGRSPTWAWPRPTPVDAFRICR